jgi:hypothetical protein
LLLILDRERNEMRAGWVDKAAEEDLEDLE